MSKIAVVILNWNGKALLEKFLPSVVAYSAEAEIYVADNASTDDSVAFLAKYYPSIKVIQNTENFGFAQGYNEALQYVDADSYALVNSDIEVTPNWLQPILKTFQNEPLTAIIQPRILDYKNKDYFEYAGAAGGFIDQYGYPFCRGRIFETIEKDELAVVALGRMREASISQLLVMDGEEYVGIVHLHDLLREGLI